MKSRSALLSLARSMTPSPMGDRVAASISSISSSSRPSSRAVRTMASASSASSLPSDQPTAASARKTSRPSRCALMTGDDTIALADAAGGRLRRAGAVRGAAEEGGREARGERERGAEPRPVLDEDAYARSRLDDEGAFVLVRVAVAAVVDHPVPPLDHRAAGDAVVR